jgi:hypothetical protein
LCKPVWIFIDQNILEIHLCPSLFFFSFSNNLFVIAHRSWNTNLASAKNLLTYYVSSIHARQLKLKVCMHWFVYQIMLILECTIDHNYVSNSKCTNVGFRITHDAVVYTAADLSAKRRDKSSNHPGCHPAFRLHCIMDCSIDCTWSVIHQGAKLSVLSVDKHIVSPVSSFTPDTLEILLRNTVTIYI